MFYFLYEVLYSDSGIFRFLRLFQYITIRTGLAFITGFILFIIFGKVMLSYLSKKNFRDKVKEYMVESHKAKEGTPTLGGIFIFLFTVISALLWTDLSNSFIQILLIGSFLSFLIGFYDDITKLNNKKKGCGISAKLKFSLLFIAALAIGVLLYLNKNHDAKLIIPIFKNLAFNISYFYIPFIILVLLSTSNAVNLTDGLDGLAISICLIIFFTLALIAYLSGNMIYANYLNLPFIKDIGEITVYGGCVIGVGFGFLWYNFYPSQVFMGDSGSLNLGFNIGMMSIMVKQELLLIIFGGILFMEALSVILQVGSVKLFKKRVFKMAPLHHHFERMNVPESKLVIRFIIVAIILAIIALISIKVR